MELHLVYRFELFLQSDIIEIVREDLHSFLVLRKQIDFTDRFGIINRLVLVALYFNLGCVFLLTHPLLQLLVQLEEIVLPRLLLECLANYWLFLVLLLFGFRNPFNCRRRSVFSLIEAELLLRVFCLSNDFIGEVSELSILFVSFLDVLVVLMGAFLLLESDCTIDYVIAHGICAWEVLWLLSFSFGRQWLLSSTDILCHFVWAVFLLEKVSLWHLL